MANIHDYFGTHHRVWDKYDFAPAAKVTISEIWKKQTTAPSSTSHKSIHQDLSHTELLPWLRGDSKSSPPNLPEHHTRRVRFVWVPTHVRERYHDIRASDLDTIVSNFNHQITWKGFTSSFAEICYLPTQRPSELAAGYLCNHPKLAMTWTYDSYTGLTNIICLADENKVKTFKELLDQPFIQEISDHHLVAPLLCAIIYSREIDHTQNTIKKQVRETEVRSGHHGWSSRSESAAPGDLISLSAKMSGCRTKGASCARKIEVLTAWITFMLEQLDSPSISTSSSSQDSHHRPTEDEEKTFRFNVKALQHRTHMQKVDADFVGLRVQTQIEALFHLTAENDTIFTHELAKDARLLAHVSQRDSSSMKSLSVVTMFFLPGTFVSSLFSMPLFDWGSAPTNTIATASNVWGPRLTVYLAWTGPLTLLTFAIWGLWMFKQSIDDRKRKIVAESSLESDLLQQQTSESGMLARRWTTLSGTEGRSDGKDG